MDCISFSSSPRRSYYFLHVLFNHVRTWLTHDSFTCCRCSILLLLVDETCFSFYFISFTTSIVTLIIQESLKNPLYGCKYLLPMPKKPISLDNSCLFRLGGDQPNLFYDFVQPFDLFRILVM